MRTSSVARTFIFLTCLTTISLTGANAVMAVAPGTGKLPSGATLVLSKFKALNPNGEDVLIEGKNFDTKTGIYVALCRVVKSGNKPDPCGGGADMTGTSGASAWITSNPPAYGAAIATPYNSSGGFLVKLRVNAKVGSLDCRKVQCAIYTRADHLSGGDRSFDIAVPVTFAKKGKPVKEFVPLPKPTPSLNTSSNPSASAAPTPSPSSTVNTSPKEKNSVVATTSTGLVLKTAGMPPVLKISTPIQFSVTSTSGANPVVMIDAANTKGECAVTKVDAGYELKAISGTQCVVMVTVPANDRYETGIGIYPFIVQP